MLKSLRKTLKRWGPLTLHWVVPLLTGFQSHSKLLQHTICFLSFKKFKYRLVIYGFSGSFFNLLARSSCFTEWSGMVQCMFYCDVSIETVALLPKQETFLLITCILKRKYFSFSIYTTRKKIKTNFSWHAGTWHRRRGKKPLRQNFPEDWFSFPYFCNPPVLNNTTTRRILILMNFAVSSQLSDVWSLWHQKEQKRFTLFG